MAKKELETPGLDIVVEGKSYAANVYKKSDDSAKKRKLGFNAKVVIGGKRYQINGHLTEIVK